ncbi:MAG TPA: alkaline phosphatase family protein [Trueperaceae bacterium]|nr:alkaline phosphatase family protein [Trueperaceae bacterium]
MGDALASLLGSHATRCTMPAYGGGSILNLPAEIGRLLGVARGWEAPPLTNGVSLDTSGVRRVAMLVIDGLGWPDLRAYAALDPVWHRLEARYGGASRVLTSVAPATTAVATTALLSNGASPARSGVLGYSQRLAAIARVADMLYWRTVPAPGGPAEPLEALGIVPETFLPTPSLFETLARGDVRAEAFLPARIRNSPLSRMQFRGAAPRGAADLTDTLRQLAAQFEAQPELRFAYAYHPDLDTVGHLRGPGGGAWAAALAEILATLEAWLAALPGAVRHGTLLLITADHGLVPSPPERRRTLGALDGVPRLLAAPAGGEPRHVHLYARAGAADALVEAARRALGDDFVVLPGRDALDAGLYGDPARRHPDAGRRVGDAVVLALGDATLWSGDAEPTLNGMHGALDPREMQVPLLALPLDG